MELYPPQFSASISGIEGKEMLVLPLHIKGQRVDFVIAIGNKIEMKQDSLPEGDVDIIDVVEEVSQALSLRAENRNMSIKIKFGRNIPEINGDRAQIKQVIQNLTDNAIKYGANDSKISISAVKSAVDGSPSRRNNGASRKSDSMMQALSTDGEQPVRTA